MGVSMAGANTIEKLTSEEFISIVKRLYGADKLEYQTRRYKELYNVHSKKYGEGGVFYSSPGRIEVCGNHTDHNHGKVLAGSINLDCVGAAAKNDSRQIRIVSETYNQDFTIDLDDLTPSPQEVLPLKLFRGEVEGLKALPGFSAGSLGLGFMLPP